MNEISSRIAGLIAKQLNGDLDEQERQELESWAQESDIYRGILEKFTNDKLLFNAVQNSYKNEEQILNQIKERMLADKGRSIKVVGIRRYVWVRITAAATIVILLSIGAFVWFNSKQHKEVIVAAKQTNPSNDIAPGKDGAILKLADGKEIILDNSANGNLARQGASTVVKQGTELRYNNEGKSGAQVLYNTLTTPRARQFRLVLPDGSRVWLNASSSITFPSAFTVGSERRVSITGEAYFEVAKDTSKPFLASVENEMKVEVVGTHFNINAYKDEGIIKTTLLEGKVKVKKGTLVSTLIPGQQAAVSDNIKLINNPDLDEVVAWKDGLIVFNSTDIKKFFKEIERWYAVDVVYTSKLNVPRLYGKTYRNTNLSQILQFVEENTTLKFKLEGNRLFVSQ